MASKWLFKASRRAQENLLQRLGARARDEDPQFAAAQERFMAAHEQLQQVYGALRQHLASVIALSDANDLVADVAQRVSSSCDTPDCSGWQRSHREMRNAFLKTYLEEVLGPCAALLEQVPLIEEKIKQRNKAHLDLDSYRSRARNGTPNVDDAAWQNLQAKLTRSENDVAAMNRHIIQEIDALEAKRPQAIADALAAFMGTQLQWLDIQSCAIEDLLPRFPSAAVAICKFLGQVGADPANSDSETAAPWSANGFASGHGGLVGAASTSSESSSVPSRRGMQSFETAGWLQAESNVRTPTPNYMREEARQASPAPVQTAPQGRPPQRNPHYTDSPRFEDENPMIVPQEIPVERLSIAEPPFTGQYPVHQSFEPIQPGGTGHVEYVKDQPIQYVRALYDYQKQDAGDLSLRVGDIISVYSKADDGWWFGSARGEEGIFPSNYVQPA